MSKQQFLFNPNNKNKSFDVYIDKNPADTIPIKYSTVDDVKNTITKLEKLYKSKKYPHKRISQVAMIMQVRLRVLYDGRNKEYKGAKFITDRYRLAERYYSFLKDRTKLKDVDRYKTIFKF